MVSLGEADQNVHVAVGNGGVCYVDERQHTFPLPKVECKLEDAALVRDGHISRVVQYFVGQALRQQVTDASSGA